MSDGTQFGLCWPVFQTDWREQRSMAKAKDGDGQEGTRHLYSPALPLQRWTTAAWWMCAQRRARAVHLHTSHTERQLMHFYHRAWPHLKDTGETLRSGATVTPTPDSEEQQCRLHDTPGATKREIEVKMTLSVSINKPWENWFLHSGNFPIRSGNTWQRVSVNHWACLLNVLLQSFNSDMFYLEVLVKQ